MDRSEAETIVRTWLDRASVDERTGVPPDAKVTVDARDVTTFGQLAPGESRPASGMDVWIVTATLYFPESSDAWDEPNDRGLAIAQVLDRLQASLDADPTLGRAGLRVEYRGTDGSEPHERPGSPPGYPWAVEMYLSAHHVGS